MHLSIMKSNRCNFGCRHCIHGSSARQRRVLPQETIRGLIRSAALVSGTERLIISFTGGEPFLHFEDLLENAREAKKSGASLISCISNCFWAVSEEAAGQMLGDIKRSGIDQLSVSYDRFHDPYVSLEHIRNAFKAAVEAGIQVKFKTVVFRDSERAYQFLEGLKDLTCGTSFQVEENLCLPVGRAESLPGSLFLYCEGFPRERCYGLGNILAGHDGNVYPCCCAAFSGPLRLGNIHRDTLQSLVEKFNGSVLFKVLRDRGPAYFLPYLRECGVILEEGTFVNACHLCRRVLQAFRTDKRTSEAFHKALDDWHVQNQAREKITGILTEFAGLQQIQAI
jgi:MoaA/NifB/PqqE/SkfB family radical SAM enzyme